jgi:hypothetical protein
VGYNLSLWTTKLVCPFIYTRFGTEYGRERARQLLHALGCRLIRLRHHYLRAKTEEQAACVPAVEELLTDWTEEAWHRLFVNEVTVRHHPTLTAPWGLRDDVPDVPTGMTLPRGTCMAQSRP